MVGLSFPWSLGFEAWHTPFFLTHHLLGSHGISLVLVHGGSRRDTYSGKPLLMCPARLGVPRGMLLAVPTAVRWSTHPSSHPFQAQTRGACLIPCCTLSPWHNALSVNIHQMPCVCVCVHEYSPHSLRFIEPFSESWQPHRVTC